MAVATADEEEEEQEQEEEEEMGDSIISIRKGVDTKELFVGGPQRSQQQQGRGRGIQRGWLMGMGGGGAIDPTKRGMRISASSKVGPRSRRLSIFRGNERESRSKEERWGWRGGLN